LAELQYALRSCGPKRGKVRPNAHSQAIGSREATCRRFPPAARLARYGGGTNCSLPLAEANGTYRDRRFAGCVLVSDLESWVGTGRRGATAVLTEWQQFVHNQAHLHGAGHPGPKLVCIDLLAATTTQAPERTDVLNIGGFSDAVFNVVAAFVEDRPERFLGEVEAVEL
jgi:60 kDa SS-A/Ro ribonucleoprotein